MNKYHLYVCMKLAKFSCKIEAENYIIKNNRIVFYNYVYEKNDESISSNTVANYPSKYTIIEKIEYGNNR